ncbi:MAG: hypothetical protein MZV70_75045 [Desulfobacterales bacterium]|nr:hypothetical protein [Desulfobacterales bacterium]
MRAGIVYLIIAIALMAVSFLKDRQKTKEALKATFKIFYVVLPVLIFVFVLMGLIQVYIPKEAIASVLGQKAGPLGILFSEIMGSIALFLPPAVFPFGGYLSAKWSLLWRHRRICVHGHPHRDNDSAARN